MTGDAKGQFIARDPNARKRPDKSAFETKLGRRAAASGHRSAMTLPFKVATMINP
jgi:hypothetical protein